MPLYARSFVDDDEELELIDPENVVVPDDAPPEEKTWGKRYADLRRLDQKKDTKIRDLEAQLSKASQSHLQLPDPNDDKALDEWVNSYPDLARVLTTLAGKQAEKATAEVKAQLEQLDIDRRAARKTNAMEALAQAHPDFFGVIRLDENFHEWLASKSQAIQDIMYRDDNEDWKSASDVISMYKAETGVITKPQTKKQPGAEREVRVQSRPTPSASSQYIFTESQIQKMDGPTYDLNEAKIAQAMKDGKVLMDITAGSR